jgi:hypothetical protein
MKNKHQNGTKHDQREWLVSLTQRVEKSEEEVFM